MTRWRERYYEIPKEQRNGKCQITASSSFFVPKPFTPFQWASMNSREEFLAKARIVKEEVKAQLNQKSIRYNYHEADVSVLEGVLARGDRRLAPVIETAYKNGALFDAWSESFRPEAWEQAFVSCGIDPDFYTSRSRNTDELLPWDFISAASTIKRFLDPGMGDGQEGKGNAELPPEMCRLRCESLRRRCLS